MPRPRSAASAPTPTPLAQLVALAKKADALAPEQLAAQWAAVQDALAREGKVSSKTYDAYLGAMVDVLLDHPELGGAVTFLAVGTDYIYDTDREEDEPKLLTVKINKKLLKSCSNVEAMSVIGRAHWLGFETLWTQVLAYAPLRRIKVLSIEAFAYDLRRLAPDLTKFTRLRDLRLAKVGIKTLYEEEAVWSEDGDDDDEWSDEEDNAGDKASARAEHQLRLTSLTLVDVGNVDGYQTSALSPTALDWLLRTAGPALVELRHRLSPDGGSSGLDLAALRTLRALAPQLRRVEVTLSPDGRTGGEEARVGEVWELLELDGLERLEVGVRRSKRGSE